MIRRISITGPESTGKSWLAEKLAGHFDEPWVPEFSRSYLQKLDRPYEFSDIAGIAEGQYASENSKAEIARRFLFCDTDFLVCHIWCRVKYGKSHPWIEQMVNRHRYDHYLLCNTDLPWEADPLREHPHFREKLLEIYIEALTDRKLPFTLVSGVGEVRLAMALDALKQVNICP